MGPELAHPLTRTLFTQQGSTKHYRIYRSRLAAFSYIEANWVRMVVKNIRKIMNEDQSTDQATVAQQPLSNVPAQPDEQAKKNNTMLMVIVGVLIVLIIGSLFAFASMANSPEARLSKALTNLRDAESVALTMKADIEDDGTTTSLSGGADIIFEPTQASLNLEIDAFVTTIGAEVLFVDGNYYVQVNGLAGVEALLSQFIGAPSTVGLSAEDQAQVTAFTDAVSRIVTELDGKWIEIQSSVAKEAGLELDAQISTVRNNYMSLSDVEDALTINQVYEDKVIDGKDALHMQLGINPARAQEILVDIFSGVTVGDETLTREEAQEGLEDLFDNYDPNKDVFEVWVDKATNQLVQLELRVQDGEEEQKITLNMSEYNSVEAKTAPENPKTLLEVTALFAPLLEQFNGLGADPSALLELPL